MHAHYLQLTGNLEAVLGWCGDHVYGSGSEYADPRLYIDWMCWIGSNLLHSRVGVELFQGLAFPKDLKKIVQSQVKEL